MIFNRRKATRETISRECRVDCPKGNWSCSGKVLNMSQGGVGLDIDEIPDTKDEIVLYMTDEKGREMKKKAVIVWFIRKTPPEIGAMVGVKFT